jgi:F-type H+-transporting ATPase subunit alpha
MPRADAPDWLAAAQGVLRNAALGPRVEHKGRVEEIGDGVALVSGLRDVRLDEVLHFEHGQVGFARVLDSDRIGCVLLDAATDVEAGDCGVRHRRSGQCSRGRGLAGADR